MTEKKYELRKQLKSVRWMIFWVVLAQFAAVVLVEAIVSFMVNPPHRYIQIAVEELLAVGVPIAIYAKTVWNGKKTKQEFCLRGCNIRYMVMAVLLGISGQFVMMLLNVPANIILNAVDGRTATEIIPVAEGWGDILIGIVALVIIPALLEEFWMRGIIFRAYNNCNTVAAVIFTALVFALLHLNLNEIAGFFFMGVVSSIVLVKSHSLYASMLYHGFSNLTALLFGAYIMPWIIDWLWIAFTVMIMVFVLVFFVLLRQKGGMKNHHTFKLGSLVITSIFSMPVILSVLTVVVKYFLLKMAG